MIFFAPFEPDKSPFNAEATDVATNAIPVADGWGPFPSFEALSATLGAECRGAIVGRSTAGDYSIPATHPNILGLRRRTSQRREIACAVQIIDLHHIADICCHDIRAELDD